MEVGISTTSSNVVSVLSSYISLSFIIIVAIVLDNGREIAFCNLKLR